MIPNFVEFSLFNSYHVLDCEMAFYDESKATLADIKLHIFLRAHPNAK